MAMGTIDIAHEFTWDRMYVLPRDSNPFRKAGPASPADQTAAKPMARESHLDARPATNATQDGANATDLRPVRQGR